MEEHEITHEELYAKIEAKIEKVEMDIYKLLGKIGITVLPFIVASFAWIWSTHSAQAEKDAKQTEKLESHIQTEDVFKQRIYSEMSSLNQYLREDTREIRKSLEDHIRDNQN